MWRTRVRVVARTLIALTVLSCSGSASLCYYGASGQVVIPSKAQHPGAPPLVDVVDKALKRYGFSDGQGGDFFCPVL
jgi:hypothetical protein